jgi:hypothetical protein
MISSARKIVRRPKALNCPQCGSAIELRAMGAAATVVCSYCNSTLDATNPQLTILQRWEAAMTVQPIIPMGSRGKLKNTIWEAIGFQQRGIEVEGVHYFWREYVLFNPYKGFRYLSEYENHWNYVTPLQSLPKPEASPVGRPRMNAQGAVFDHFQSAQATTWFVIGEFPWQVKVGEVVSTADYVCPPRMLSSETTENEVTWSLGEYLDPKEIWTGFQLPGVPPIPRGVFSNQPNPNAGKPGRPWLPFVIAAAALFLMMIGFAMTARNQQIFEKTFTYQPGAAGEKSFVTDAFDIPGNRANVHVEIDTNLDNGWAYFSMALINEQTNDAYDFGQNVSYYNGVDGGESWSEGDRKESVTLPAIPGGRYYLRIEPDTTPDGAAETSTLTVQRPIQYRVTLTRDVPYFFRYILGIVLLLIPVPFLGGKAKSFERQRWSESDYGLPPGSIAWKASSTSNSEDDD